MKKDVQHIRRSQFVLTYGPGTIIESRNGPRLIPAIEKGLDKRLFSQELFKKFEITDSRLRIALKNMTGQESRIFSLPSNASLGYSEMTGIYRTQIFPTWRICYGRKGEHDPILYKSNRGCPICHTDDDSSAVRFVAACASGHLDEVPWNLAVHGKDNHCNPEYFLWQAGGSSLSDITIKCPKCGNKTNMGDIYQTNFKCSGRFPEKEEPATDYGPFYTHPKRPFKSTCSERMKVIQRQSTSLHIPETITLLTIPEFDTSISKILQIPLISGIIGTVLNLLKVCDGSTIKEKELTTKIRENLGGKVPEEAIEKITEFIKTDGIPAFCDLFIRLHDEKRSLMDFIYEEFESLLNAPGKRPTDNFSMGPKIPSLGRVDPLPDMDIYPVPRIRTITAQLGYYRIPYTPLADAGEEEQKYVSSGVRINKMMIGESEWWYPGFEGIGEGIFITFSNKEFAEIKDKAAYCEWTVETSPSEQGVLGSYWGDVVQQPLFVWLHTLSHSIIKVLSLYSGYSSASLRERVYVDRNGTNGGILIYTTSPGEDGSMGGLVESAGKFDEILKRAVSNLEFCSNDPLCSDVRKTPDRINGAACHSCLLISETSCAHRNRWLDRHIILGD